MSFIDKMFKRAEGGVVSNDEEERIEIIPRRILTLPEFSLGYPALFKPTSFNDFMPPKFAAMAVYDIDEPLIEMYDAVQEIAEARSLRGFRNPIKRGRHHLEERMTIYISSKIRPVVRHVVNGKTYFAEEGDLYAGCRCTAEVEPFAYDTRGFKGVGFSLLTVTKVKEMNISEDEAAILMDIENFIERSKQ